MPRDFRVSNEAEDAIDRAQLVARLEEYRREEQQEWSSSMGLRDLAHMIAGLYRQLGDKDAAWAWDDTAANHQLEMNTGRDILI